MKSEQAMALIRAHFKADRAMFRSVALQIAADAANRHGGSLSKEIRRIVDTSPADGLTPLPKARDGETESLTVRNPHRLEDLILAPGILAAIRQFLDEQKYAGPGFSSPRRTCPTNSTPRSCGASIWP